MPAKIALALAAVLLTLLTCCVAGITGAAGSITALGCTTLTSKPSTSPPDDASAHPSADCEAGVAVLARAATWLTAWHGQPVPYLSSSDPTTWFDGYRRDCSGYAAMAFGLPGPGPDASSLAAQSTPITKNDLQAGDLLINPAPGPAGHVVIFDRWADATTTSYLGYEQSGDGGTHHRTIPYPYFSNYPMSPYRYRK